MGELKNFQRVIPIELSFLSGCTRFSRGWEVKFFSRGGSIFWGGEYILKLAFSYDKVLSCILQDALIRSLKYYSRKTP